MIRSLSFWLATITVVSAWCCACDWPKEVPPNEAAQIEGLIDQLAARVPEPKWDDTQIEEREPPRFPKGAKADHERIALVWSALLSKRESAFPLLVKHLDDKRYCCTLYRLFYCKFTVGHVCRLILADQIEVYRQHARFLYDSEAGHGWPHYLPDGADKLRTWWAANQTKSLIEIQREAIEFAIQVERRRGAFESKTQERETFSSLRLMLDQLKDKNKSLPAWTPYRFPRDKELR